MRWHGSFATMLMALSLVCACSRPPAENASNSSDSQKLPFDRQPSSTGVSPSHLLIPSSTKLAEGTLIPVRLQSALSSASSHAGDTFSAMIGEPVTLDGQTLVAGGTSATGRVLEARASSRIASGAFEPGYLRLVLVSLKVGGRVVEIETSSIFAKGGSRQERNAPAAAVSGGGEIDKSKDKDKDKDKDVVLGVDRRLNFRLAQGVDLQ